MKITYEYQQTIFGDIPAGGITVLYMGEAKISFLDRNKEEIDQIKILSVDVFVNGVRDPFAYLPAEKDAPFFYAKAREAVRRRWFERRMEWQ